ncbi:alpha-ketoacid dehydrogenase subunit beta [Paraburkholderia ferrariae]|uniref:alpha-ketoacid dehydrogenase subunit beta n=1 Tax=Paraburkholderia ferrariae TaxID=386056 RepID=UPI0005A77D9D|nr:transketolase C-terminal domain-containing protein [Paraburkholderia ferrariae]
MATELIERTRTQEKSPNLLQAINMALTDAMHDDAKVLVLGEDVGDREGGGIVGITRGLETRFGTRRVRSTPISEQAIVGAAIGAAIRGWKPVAEIMLMNFTTVAMDMIVNHAAKLRFMSGGQTSVPITIRTMTGAGRGSGGQHCDYLEAWFAHTAGMKVVAPSNPADAYGLLRAAIDDPDPVLFIENMPSYRAPAWGRAITPGERVPLGKGLVVREGQDLTIVSYSRMVVEALAAADTLANEGLRAEVIDLRTVSPWDRELVLQSVRKTGRLLVVHEAVTPFGVGAEIAAEVGHALFGLLKAPVERLGSAYCPVPFSKPLETAFVPSQARIVDIARAMAAS